MINRREFLAGASAGFFFGPAFAASGFVAGQLRLRIGIVSDIHFYRNKEHTGLRKWWNEELFIHALEYFRDREVDGVLIPGDLTVDGSELELSAVAAAWEKVFPNCVGKSGARVEPMFIRGNHDVRTGAFKQCWERLFHRPADEMFSHWEVKGYHFLGAHWAGPKGTPGTKATVDSLAPTFDPKKPFFFFQHPHPKSTTVGEFVWGHDAGEATAALSAYPNAFAISGHSHHPLTDERSLWQGAFTSLNAASLRYPGVGLEEFDEAFENTTLRERHPHPEIDQAKMMPKAGLGDSHPGLMMNVYDDSIVLERRDFLYDCPFGDDWVVPFPVDPSSAPFAFARRGQTFPAPQFPSVPSVKGQRLNALNRAKESRPAIRFTIPSANAEPRARVHYYAVRLSSQALGKTVGKRVLATDVCQSPSSPLFGKPVSCTIGLDDFAQAEDLKVTVTPYGFYGRAGHPLTVEIAKGNG